QTWGHFPPSKRLTQQTPNQRRYRLTPLFFQKMNKVAKYAFVTPICDRTYERRRNPPTHAATRSFFTNNKFTEKFLAADAAQNPGQRSNLLQTFVADRQS